MTTHVEPSVWIPDATDFTDIPKKDRPDFWDEPLKECPKCKGHGCWNLKKNCYPRQPDTPLHWRHFQCFCGACWGWGWIPESQTCLHEWHRHRAIAMCLSEWKCTLCGITREVDSSD